MEFYKIYTWMATDLHLKGLELLTYALIYSFCENGRAGKCWASLETMSEYTGGSVPGVKKALKALCASGLILRAKEDGFKTNIYRINASRLTHLVPPNMVSWKDESREGDTQYPVEGYSVSGEGILSIHNKIIYKNKLSRECNSSLEVRGDDTINTIPTEDQIKEYVIKMYPGISERGIQTCCSYRDHMISQKYPMSNWKAEIDDMARSYIEIPEVRI